MPSVALAVCSAVLWRLMVLRSVRSNVRSSILAGLVRPRSPPLHRGGVIAREGEPAEVVENRGLAVVSDDGALGAAIDEVIAANPDVAQKIRDGKVQAAGALIGQVMKAMKGQADAGRVRELLLEKLA